MDVKKGRKPCLARTSVTTLDLSASRDEFRLVWKTERFGTRLAEEGVGVVRTLLLFLPALQVLLS